VISVFDDQHNLWTNVFDSVYIYSSKDVEWTWIEVLREQHLKEDNRRLINSYQHQARVQGTRQESLESSLCPRTRSGCLLEKGE
jgi:hypothetical protein